MVQYFQVMVVCMYRYLIHLSLVLNYKHLMIMMIQMGLIQMGMKTKLYKVIVKKHFRLLVDSHSQLILNQ